MIFKVIGVGQLMHQERGFSNGSTAGLPDSGILAFSRNMSVSKLRKVTVNALFSVRKVMADNATWHNCS